MLRAILHMKTSLQKSILYAVVVLAAVCHAYARTTVRGGGFELVISDASQTLESLVPFGSRFDFLPSDRLEKRSANGFYHLGDVRFAVRVKGDTEWKWYSTAAERKPIETVALYPGDLAAADLSASLPSDCPLKVVRRWTEVGGQLVLRFEFANKTSHEIELGAVGIPLPFNNILTDRSLKEAHEKCSFSDPYIGMDAGYVQVTRLKGTGPALVVVPDGRTPFEGYQLVPEPMRVAQTFEGTFEWLAHTRALAETTWKDVEPWNEPTSEILPPNGKTQFGLKFLVADQIRNIEKTLLANSLPVVVGVPGYILPAGLDGKLFLKSPAKIASVEVEPEGAIDVRPTGTANGGYAAYSVAAKGWGRARLTVKYTDGSTQTIHYYLTKSAGETVADLGRFLFTRQWFDRPGDPFGRSPSVISYDRERDAPVEQDNRAWIAGLGDEAGSGSWLAAAMKEEVAPDRSEIAKYEQFIDQVLWGGIQYSNGDNKFGVRKSMFYYAPSELTGYKYDPAFNWTTWASWKKDQAQSIGRGYNYPHVVAAYLAMYRVARNTDGLIRNHAWDWYLDQAVETTKFAFGRKPDGTRRVEYVELGLMEGTVFLELLKELRREGLNEKADAVEKLMKERADEWKTEEYPFGSEMAWDSTGQEEVYAWCDHFGYDDKALVSLNSIIGYMPTIPHWGYNGNARRYWDFLYGGKLRRIERQLHHYGSGLNAIPVLSYFREHPDDLYLLRIGYGGAMGALSNIDRDGFASAAFHSYPDTLRWDAYSGDYGPNFFGHALNSATYVVEHPEFGWLAFGGNLSLDRESVRVIPLDAVRRRIYVAKLGLWLTLDAGRFEEIRIARDGKSVGIRLAPATEFESKARLRVERVASVGATGKFVPNEQLKVERGAYSIALGGSARRVQLKLSR